ncbi:MAG: hypothetical protein AAB445_03220 [Patescibacteria group bacterium]|mgnify:CR=1 FL=1
MFARKPKAFITLISVLILGAVGVAIALSLVLLGVGASRSAFASGQSVQAKNLANACAETALNTIRSTPAFTGTIPLTLGAGTCSATITNTGGTTRLVVASGTVGTVVRRVSITVATVAPVTLTSWQEVAN